VRCRGLFENGPNEDSFLKRSVVGRIKCGGRGGKVWGGACGGGGGFWGF